MTYQSNPQRSGFRELNLMEISAVSGGNDQVVGEIIVTGKRGNNFTSISAESLASLGIFGFADGGLLGLGVQYGVGSDGMPIDWTLPPQDIDGDGDPGITVTGEKFKAPDGYTLGPVNPSTGLIHIMYLNGPDGRPDLSKPPVLTPDGEKFACDTYEQGMKAVDQTMGQSGTAATLTGILYGNPGSLPLIGGIAGLTTTYSAPAHCP